MATYVNDLRLKEIGTGESSGTWGTETNVNLELIGEALGFGTEAITTNADTHTTTVADGSTDPGRAMYIKYTGTPDSACTITIGPNTMSRLHYIENATSGSQNIIISQGSGANITIPAGDTKAVYLDGAGSGAAVVDVFASFSAVDLKVQDDLTVTDDATIGGTLGVTGILTCTDDIIIGDGKTIGSASDVDAMTIAANGQVTFTQTLIGTALDISGDIDVDGTANLDIVDIDGATNIAAAVTMATNNKIQFRDDAIHISSTADGQLDLVADTEIQIAATTIDINGAINASGEIIAASLDISGNIDVDGTTNLDVVDIDGAVDLNAPITIQQASYFIGNSTNGFRFNNSSDAQTLFYIKNTGEAVFNDNSIDYDFRVESNGNDHMLFVDGGNDRVGIGVAPTSVFEVQDANSVSIKFGDLAAYPDNVVSCFIGTGTSGLAGVNGDLVLVPRTSDAGKIVFATGSSGAASENMRILHSGIVINEGGADRDFRVESDGNANMLLVDGGANKVSVGTTANSGILTVGNSLSIEGDLAPTGAGLMLGDNNSGSYKWIQSFSSQALRLNPLGNEVSIGITGTATPFKTFGGAVFNEDGADVDFRVESDNLTHAFVVDGGEGKTGIGANATGARLSVFEGGNSTIVAYIQNGSSSINNSSASMLYLQATVDASIQDGYKMVQFADSNTVLGSISTAASSTNVSYNTSSDERLKENIVDMPSQLENILKVQPRQFDWKKHGNTANGFIAQELYETYPEAVTVGLEDETQDPWSVDYGRLTPYMIKAMQEQQEIIESLKARIAALENK